MKIHPTLQPVCLGTLGIDPGHHPGGQAHLSAASGLVRSGHQLFVVADDELHLGVFDDTISLGKAPPQGRLLHLVEGVLPQAPSSRKARKPDWEALALLPALPGNEGGALLALGSGSAPNRERGVILALEGPGRPDGRRALVDFAPLYQPLRQQFFDLNIEAAWVSGGDLHLLQRGNQRDPRSACIRYDWDLVAPWLSGTQPLPPQAKSVQVVALGSIDGVALSLTDGAALPGGGWVFSAVSEDTSDSVQDGRCVASAVGVVTADGVVRERWLLHGAPKVEGVAVRRLGDTWELTLVTDPDDPARAAQWLSLRLPLALG